MSNLATAFSDLVLAVSSFYAASVVYQRYTHAFVGFATIGAAATAGIVKFLDLAPSHSFRVNIVRFHSKLTWLATILGIAMIGASFCVYYNRYQSCQLHVVAVIICMVFYHLYPKFQDAFTNFPATLGIFSIFFQSFQANNMYGMMGAALYGIPSIMMKTQGSGFPGVDVFHYCLAIANIILSQVL